MYDLSQSRIADKRYFQTDEYAFNWRRRVCKITGERYTTYELIGALPIIKCYKKSIKKLKREISRLSEKNYNKDEVKTILIKSNENLGDEITRLRDELAKKDLEILDLRGAIRNMKLTAKYG